MHPLENKVIYQIYPKSFLDTTSTGEGDIKGIISKLDYLDELGIDYIWLSPVNKSPQNDNGYDIEDYYEIDERFGSKDDYLELIAEANKRGIKIMMDLVLNHTSTNHEWFKKALKGDQKYLDYYFFRKDINDMQSSFSGSAWNYVPFLDLNYLCVYDKTQADLNWDNEEVRRELYKVVNYWIDLGVEGFRLDVILDISKDLDKNMNAFGPNLSKYIIELNNNTFKDSILTVGECWHACHNLMSSICHANGLFQAFRFSDISITNDVDKWHQIPFNLNRFAQVLEDWQEVYKGCNAIVMNNHDLPRLISLWLDDQEYRVQSAKLLVSIFGFIKGNLYLYQGEEIGMTNPKFVSIQQYRDIESLNKYQLLVNEGIEEKEILDLLSKVSRDNARTPMQWNRSNNAGFSDSKPWIDVNSNYLEVNVEADLNSEFSIFKFYKNIISFRKENYHKLCEDYDFIAEGKLLIMENKHYKIVANFSNDELNYSKVSQYLFTNVKEYFSNKMLPYEVYIKEK